jgi:predicted secreted protein
MARTINAVDVNVSIGDVIVGCAKSASLKVSRAMDPATCGASGAWSQASPGLKSWTGSISAQYRIFTQAEAATNVSAQDVFDMLDEGTLVDVEYGTTTSGDQRFKGQAYISGFNYDQPENGAVTWSADLTGNGPITKLTVV